MFMALSGVAIADNPFARAEIIGKVTSVFPEAGLIMINGTRYEVTKDVVVLDESGNPLEGGIKALESGMRIQYGFSSDANKRGVAFIILSND